MAGTGSRKMGNAKAPNPSTNKRIGVGSGNSTSAKFVKPTLSAKQQRVRDAIGKSVINASKGTAYKGLAREGATAKGGMPVFDYKDANRLNLSKKYPNSQKI